MINKADGMMPSTFDFEYVAREVAFLVVYKRCRGDSVLVWLSLRDVILNPSIVMGSAKFMGNC